MIIIIEFGFQSSSSRCRGSKLGLETKVFNQQGVSAAKSIFPNHFGIDHPDLSSVFINFLFLVWSFRCQRESLLQVHLLLLGVQLEIPDLFASLQESSKTSACYLYSSQWIYISILAHYYSIPGTFQVSSSKKGQERGRHPFCNRSIHQAS